MLRRSLPLIALARGCSRIVYALQVLSDGLGSSSPGSGREGVHWLFYGCISLSDMAGSYAGDTDTSKRSSD